MTTRITRPINTLFLLATFAIGGTAACQSASKERVLPPDAYAQELTKKDIQLIDVRTPGEYKGGHLEGAKLMDWSGGQLQKEWSSLDKSRPIMIYCASGRRSAAASEFLRKNGFTDITDLAGGYGAWSAAGKPVVK
ncbi:MAG: rhodanese-like domain-containing protein [Flavobacteriales bacterium]|nr:rhodanese-like domain-containing protein [Flavobacteriales bacterium]